MASSRALAALGLLLSLVSGCGTDDGTTETPTGGTTAGGTGGGGSTGVPAGDAFGGTDGGGTSDDGAGPAPDTKPPVACVAGIPCDDEDPCTVDDRCVDGFCKGDVATVCDDGRPCTSDECDGRGGCLHPVKSGFCLVNNVCIAHGTASPDDPCERCDTDLRKTGWSKLADLSPCDDGNPCTLGDYCQKGACKKGVKITCDDNNQCTKDTCDTGVGCKNTPISGPCDDGDPCTTGSVCSGGVCYSPVQGCDDHNPCTTDTCLPDLGCQHVPFSGPCEDGDACTASDTCQAGTCVSGPPLACGDGSDCTDDHCDPVFGCYQTLVEDNPCCLGSVHLCEDGNPCTTDGCDDQGACSNLPHGGACDDGNPCTTGDACQGGTCVAGPADACNDGNPCTTDSCNEAVGCQHVAGFGPCDDGIPCTTGDTCVAGQCVGDATDCKCEPDFGVTVAKATKLLIGESGQPGQGLDVDQKPGTCAPPDGCSGGVDNSLSVLSFLANAELEKALASGQVIFLVVGKNAKTDGTPFDISLFTGKKATSGCDIQTQSCDYLVEDSGLTEDCEALVVLDNATIKNGKLVAGGPGYDFGIALPIFGETPFALTLYNGRIEADVVLDAQKRIISAKGVIGGAVPKSTFIQALELVPDKDLPVPKESIVQILEVLLVQDIDTGPPAGPDAASIGLVFEAVGGQIVGVK